MIKDLKADHRNDLYKVLNFALQNGVELIYWYSEFKY